MSLCRQPLTPPAVDCPFGLAQLSLSPESSMHETLNAVQPGLSALHPVHSQVKCLGAGRRGGKRLARKRGGGQAPADSEAAALLLRLREDEVSHAVSSNNT